MTDLHSKLVYLAISGSAPFVAKWKEPLIPFVSRLKGDNYVVLHDDKSDIISVGRTVAALDGLGKTCSPLNESIDAAIQFLSSYQNTHVGFGVFLAERFSAADHFHAEIILNSNKVLCYRPSLFFCSARPDPAMDAALEACPRARHFSGGPTEAMPRIAAWLDSFNES